MSGEDRALVETDRLSVIWLDRVTLAELVGGVTGPAERRIAAVIPDEWIEVSRWLCALRLAQMQREPAASPWLIRAVVWKDAGTAIGQIGFHGPPGVNGLRAKDAVELGYSILPAYQGRGFATEAAAGLVEWAAIEHGVRRFLASSAPTNAPSIRVLEKLGFIEVSRVWDDDDGEEIVFERRLP